MKEYERQTVTGTRRGRHRTEQELTCPRNRRLTSVLEELKHTHTIGKHQCLALQAKLLGLTLKYSIFIPFSITKIINTPTHTLPLAVPSFQTLITFSNLFSLVIVVRKIIWISKSLIFQPLFLTSSNNSNVSERSISTQYSDWCFCHLWIFFCTTFLSLKLINPELSPSQLTSLIESCA